MGKSIWLISVVILLVSYVIYYELDIIDTVELSPSTDAKCLDGTNYKFELSKGFGEGSDKFILFFEGGGWCIFHSEGYDLENCFQRTKITWGSSKYIFSKSIWISRLFYILSSKEKFNPNFYNWNKILVRYCDGFGHQGYSEEPLQYNNTLLYLRGYNNTMGVVNYLKNNLNLMNSNKVVLSGHSAGGSAAMYWSNYIKENLNPDTKVYTIVDSGVFLDVPNKKNEFKMRNNWIRIANLTQKSENEFIKSFCNSTDLWKCFLPEYFIDNIKVPVMLVNSLYDSWSIFRLVGEPCIFENKKMLDKCDNKVYIEEYKNKLFNLFVEITKRNKNINVWLTNCITHSFLFAVSDFYDYNIGFNNLSLSNSIEYWLDNPSNYTNVLENKQFDLRTCENVKDLYYWAVYFKFPTS